MGAHCNLYSALLLGDNLYCAIYSVKLSLQKVPLRERYYFGNLG